MVTQCKVCGVKYDVCVKCKKEGSWRVHTDTTEHYYIFTTLMDYMVGKDIDAAHEALERRDIHTDASYIDSVNALIEEIYAPYQTAKEQEVDAEPETTEEAEVE